MAKRDRIDDATSGRTPPIDPPAPGTEPSRAAPEPQRRPGTSDAGRTGGGGSLGHVQPDKVEREAALRNNVERRDSDEPTLPASDAALNTKI